MKVILTLIFCSLLFSCTNNDSNNNGIENEEQYVSSRFDESSGLKTGIYKLTDSISGNKLTLDKDPAKIYWVSDTPLIEFNEFNGAKEFTYRYLGKEIPAIKISLDESARERWKNYTNTNIGRRVAIVINGILVQVPKIRSRIEGGIVAINRDDYNKNDIKSINNYLIKELNLE